MKTFKNIGNVSFGVNQILRRRRLGSWFRVAEPVISLVLLSMNYLVQETWEIF